MAEFVFSSANWGVNVNADMLAPRLRTLAQLDANGDTVLTAPTGSGSVHLAKLEAVTVNSALFPDLNEFKPLVVTRADPFRLTFPVPTRRRLAWT
jgi:hypothetical protein